MRDLRTLFTLGTIGEQTDRQLIGRFLAREGDAAESAFATLVDRHGPMVLGVCRRILSDPHDIQDAFQATFLVLVKKAGSVRVDDSLGRWLYGVSVRVARRSRAVRGRRKSREEPVSEELPAAPSYDADQCDLRAVLDEELIRLPATYRAALVLCYLEGYTHEQAARQLGWPVGTVRSRLARGRERMRLRLMRRGLAPSAGLSGSMLAVEVNSATVPAGLVEATLRVATRTAAGKAAMAGAVPAAVAALSETVIRTMLMTKLRIAASALLILGVVAVGAGGLARQQPEDREKREVQQVPEAAVKAPDHPEAQLRREIQGAARSVSSVPFDKTARNGGQVRIHTLLVLAKTQAKMGDMDAARETLVRAVQVAESIKLEGDRMENYRPEALLARIALVQAEVGHREDARVTLRKVIEATKHLKYDQGKLSILEIIVSVHMALGDRDDARETLPMMREIAQKTEEFDSDVINTHWYYLILATARTGDYRGATAIAIESSRLKFASSDSLDNGLMDIAMIAAESGNVKEALRVSEPIANVKSKELALRRIAMIQVVAGDVEGTRAWIDRLDSPRLKARALDGLAMGLAARAGVGWEAMGTISELSR